MAKKKITEFDTSTYDQQQLRRAEYYNNVIGGIYDKMIVDLAGVAAGINNVKDTIFTFDDYPSLKPRVDTILNNATIQVRSAINNGITDAWNLSNVKNDALVNFVAENSPLSERNITTYLSRNLEALAQTRTPIAQLSSNVFNITKQFKSIAEYSMDRGIGEGMSASSLATEIRKGVADPEFAFRRVRDDNGVLQWSKSFRRYQQENNLVGQTGVYNNPQKNYERLTRTEINRSYRKADQARYADMDFVVGVRINLSNNPNHCKMCEALAGDYPKNFVWSGWHPQCRCYKTSILKTDKEIEDDNVRILQDKELLKLSENSVRRMPDNFNSWVSENKESLTAAIKRGKTAYWIRDAYTDGDFSKGVNLKP